MPQQQQNQNQNDRLINVGAAWEKTAQGSGARYFSLKFNQDIKAGTWLKAFWVAEKSSERGPDLSIAGQESDGYVPEQYGQGQQQQPQQQGGGNRGNGGQQQNRGGNQNQNRGGGNQGGNRGNGGGQQQNRGGSRPPARPPAQTEFTDEFSVDQPPF